MVSPMPSLDLSSSCTTLHIEENPEREASTESRRKAAFLLFTSRKAVRIHKDQQSSRASCICLLARSFHTHTHPHPKKKKLLAQLALPCWKLDLLDAYVTRLTPKSYSATEHRLRNSEQREATSGIPQCSVDRKALLVYTTSPFFFFLECHHMGATATGVTLNTINLQSLYTQKECCLRYSAISNAPERNWEAQCVAHTWYNTNGAAEAEQIEARLWWIPHARNNGRPPFPYNLHTSWKSMKRRMRKLGALGVRCL
jgi:hypothetical protein